MRKKHLLFSITLVVMLFTVQTIAQITIDGDSTDWADIPIQSFSERNYEGLVPPEAETITNAWMDIKFVKAKIEGNKLYYFIKFWEGNSWPNRAEYDETENYDKHRGDFRFLIDVDNDTTTGWNTHKRKYKTHDQSSLGFHNSTGAPNSDAIGGDIAVTFSPNLYLAREGGTAPTSDLGFNARYYYREDPADYTTTKYDKYFATETLDVDTLNAEVGNQSLLNEKDETDVRYFWGAQAWGDDFLEVGVELTTILEDLEERGISVQAGDEWGIASIVEVPFDGWQKDFSGRGVLTVPDMDEMRPSAITFDGDDSDWADKPVLVTDPDNLPGLIPWTVLTHDKVDIKEVKAFYDAEEEMFYWFNRMHYIPNENTPDIDNGPIWPNYIEESDTDYQHKVFLSFYLDLDNDPSTGASNFVVDGDTSAAYFWQTQGYYTEADKIGAEAKFSVDLFISPNEGVKEQYYSVYDISQSIDADVEKERLFRTYARRREASTTRETSTAADTAKSVAFSGYGYNHPDKSMDAYANQISYLGHAWGDDFIESGFPVKTLKEYFKDTYGVDYFQNGQTIKVAGIIETSPTSIGWAYEASGGGSIDIVTGVEENNQSTFVSEYKLENNYPNPFNPTTVISFSLPEASQVTLKVFNVLGQEVATLVNEMQNSGVHTVNFDASGLASGIYLYKIEAGSFVSSKKMLLLR